MLHKNISQQTAEGIKILRKRINIPSSKLDETINIATWNIREFGKKKRKPESIHYIAEILSNFDLIALTELRENLEDLKRVKDVLGPYWKIIFSDSIMDDAGNEERIAYIYDKRAMTFTGLAAEADPARTVKGKERLPDMTWWRSPYMASFSAGRFDFVLLTAHIRWADKVSDRIAPLKYLAEWVDERKNSLYVVDRDIIVMGDFNIPSRGSKTFKAITSQGLEIPNALLGVKGTNLSQKNTYDQILHYRRHTKTFKDIGGAANFYKNDWRSLYPKNIYPNMTKEKFTFQISDHLPLWIQLDTWTDDEELDQILNQ